MNYPHIVKAAFVRRVNRFLAICLVDGRETAVHVKNTGRCRELLTQGAVVYLQKHDSDKRKTAYSLITVEKGGMLVNIDSQAPNQVVLEALRDGRLTLLPAVREIRPETVYAHSRFDFFLRSETASGFAEVKGCTLEEHGAVRFPDAPTLRGLRHLQELAGARRQGLEAFVVFVVQMEQADYFTPNRQMHPEFADALLAAREAGVQIRALTCRVTPGSLCLKEDIPIRLK